MSNKKLIKKVVKEMDKVNRKYWSRHVNEQSESFYKMAIDERKYIIKMNKRLAKKLIKLITKNEKK